MNVRLSFEPLSLILYPQSCHKIGCCKLWKSPKNLFCKSLEIGLKGNEKGTGQKRTPSKGSGLNAIFVWVKKQQPLLIRPAHQALSSRPFLAERAQTTGSETCGRHPVSLPKSEIELDELSNWFVLDPSWAIDCLVSRLNQRWNLGTKDVLWNLYTFILQTAQSLKYASVTFPDLWYNKDQD